MVTWLVCTAICVHTMPLHAVRVSAHVCWRSLTVACHFLECPFNRPALCTVLSRCHANRAQPRANSHTLITYLVRYPQGFDEWVERLLDMTGWNASTITLELAPSAVVGLVSPMAGKCQDCAGSTERVVGEVNFSHLAQAQNPYCRMPWHAQTSTDRHGSNDHSS